MLRLLFDQDFSHDILRGLMRRLPEIDSVTARQVGLAQAPDAELLEWAAGQRRVIVTHDVNTMPDHAYRRMRQGAHVAGLICVPQDLPIGIAIAELEMLVACSLPGEWDNLIAYLPL